MYNPDNPIQTTNSDVLNRQYFATKLANAIRKYEHIESLVIGIYGEWGSGKTSIANLLKNELEEQFRGSEESTPIFVDFNPWNFSDQNSVASTDV